MKCPDGLCLRPFETPQMGGRFGVTLPCPSRSIQLPGRGLSFCQSPGLLLDSPGNAGRGTLDRGAVVALGHHTN
jgi:hypothetical protein